MSEYTFGSLSLDPAVNPAVIDTGTWNSDAVKAQCRKLSADFIKKITANIGNPDTFEVLSDKEVNCYISSLAAHAGLSYGLLGFPDAQTAFISIGKRAGSVLKDSLLKIDHGPGHVVHVYPTTSENIHAYVTEIHTMKGPKALGPIPRLGLGVRHTTTMWPGIWNAMYRGDFSANPIQNSVRELHLLDTLRNGVPSRTNHLFSIGPVKEGHTGSTFEGLWSEGVLTGLKHPRSVRFGADADHLQVKRGSEGVERTKKFIDASRYYTFYTLDVSDILDYRALSTFSAAESAELLEACIPDENLRRDVSWYHRRKKSLGKQYIDLDEARIGRLIGKYWHALDAVEELCRYIESIKQGEPFDLELSIDENPPFVRTFDTITTGEELLFLVDEIERRKLPVTHLAPNFGVEKATDYRGEDGLLLFERRIELLHKIASEKNMMLDCHSGDDLSRSTRWLFSRATRGNIHFKLSPSLQTLYTRVLADLDPELFSFWWQDTLEFAQENAASGASFARHSLQLFERSGSRQPSPEHMFFKEYCFATVGKRDEQGNYIHRDKFYDLPNEFYSEMAVRMEQFIMEAAEDLFSLK
jgi:hypothetical protein